MQVAGRAIDHGISHVRVIGLLAIGQLVVALIVLRWFPETAHRELEELNPQDRVERDAVGGAAEAGSETPPAVS